MRYALTAEQIRLAEERAQSASAVTLGELMERAGAEVARTAAELSPAGPILVLAGPGNNGGDGWVAARILHAAGRHVRVIAPGGLPSAQPAKETAASAIDAGVPGSDALLDDDPTALTDAALVIDALFGIGLHAEPREPFAAAIHELASSSAPILSVDVPSGVNSDTGSVPGAAVRATVTLTFSAPKPGLLMFPGAEFTGDLQVVDIGLAEEDLGRPGDLEVWDETDYRALLPVPSPDAHKNSRGRVLVVGGSGAFPGAAILAATGAQRSGAGYVTLAVPQSIADIANAVLPSVVVVPLAENPSRTVASKAAETVLDLAADHDAVVVGPGLTLAHGAVLLARTIVSRVDVPLVIDADALNALVDATELLTSRAYPTLLTPHPGELARLLDVTPAEVQHDRLSYATRLAGGMTTCVLKGARTIVADSRRRMVDLAGTIALAHAGTGDVLAGVAGTLLAQGVMPYESGVLATYLHGWAGRLAGEVGSELAVTAEDVSVHLPGAIRRLTGR